MSNILITGSNRGIGLEWARQYADEGWKVYATCRHPEIADDLRELAKSHKNVSIHRLDVTRPDEINSVAVELKGLPIDLLVNNAGVYLEKFWDSNLRLRRINYENWMYCFQVNTLGPVRVTEALLDNVGQSDKKLVIITSTHMASISEIAEPGAYYYRSTKAALNAAMEGMTLEFREMDVGVLILHPGHVKTRMGGDDAPLLPPESVRGMRRLVDQFSMKHTGRFYRYDGVEMPW